MPDDHSRLARAVHQPALVRLHRRLSRLPSLLTVMNTGAHPDDEASGMLAALRFAFGMRVVVACSTAWPRMRASTWLHLRGVMRTWR